ncbi:hypothetical protein GN958_ATG14671 [Phytophthora infestans]|uniref:Uncharacterized protein n=1 Tax=Phytophthora infestans TaxID=4787 RepID=A0A8S9U774_PHYIN|nr:hypothetical protein GN958_ATG14671 [Phytophthora infestans]
MDFYGEEGSETEEGRYEGDSGDGEREEGPTSEQTERLYDWLLAEKRAEVVHVEIDCLEKAARECAEVRQAGADIEDTIIGQGQSAFESKDAAEETAAEPVWSKATFKTNVKTKPDIKKEYGQSYVDKYGYGATTHDYYFGSRQ